VYFCHVVNVYAMVIFLENHVANLFVKQMLFLIL
jgi:hypothetical protein